MKRKIVMLFAVVCMSATAIAQSVVQHTVVRGETVTSVARKYNVSEEQLRKANPDIDTYFYVGMKLNIPAAPTTQNKTVVKQDAQAIKPDIQVVNKTTQANNIPTTSSVATNNVFLEETKNGDYKGGDVNFLYQSEGELYGIEAGTNINSYLAWTLGAYSNLKFDSDEYSLCFTYIGIGAKRCFVFDNSYLFQFRCLPYLGLTSVSIGKNVEMGREALDKTDFTYGIMADVSAGLKLWKTKSGSTSFLTIGYKLHSNEFKTKNLLKSGSLMVGITTVWD